MAFQVAVQGGIFLNRYTLNVVIRKMMTENELNMIGGEILELKVANRTYLVDMSNEQPKHKNHQSQEDVSGTRVHIQVFYIEAAV